MSELLSLPSQGTDWTTIEREMEAITGKVFDNFQGRLGSQCLRGTDEVQDIAHRAYDKFFHENGILSGRLPELGKIEKQVQDMCVSIFGAGPEGACNLTSGGSESNFSGLHAAREWAREAHPHITEPEFIIPWSAHPTFTKSGHYLNIKMTRVPLSTDYRANVAAMAKVVNRNTIGIAGSAPCWPYGLFDPLKELGELALEKNLWLHVDACVGGYLSPFVKKIGYPVPDFDFTLPGVKSIAADLHKYGFVAKPCSSILWRHRDLQKYHYFPFDDWPSGPYMTEGFNGSRPAGAIYSAWAVLRYLGEEGYCSIAKTIMSRKRELDEGIAAIDGLQPWKNDLSMVCFEAQELDVGKINAGMTERGWLLFGVRQPQMILIPVDPVEPEIVARFLEDLAEVVKAVRADEIQESVSLDYT
jgi:sphinganine-1-phosphate aldolase